MTYQNENEEMGTDAVPRSRRSFTGLAIAGVAILAAVAAAYFLTRQGGESGRPVPAPATVRFDGADEGSVKGGETLVLQPTQVANAGIKTEETQEVALDSSGTINGTGVLSADAYGDVPVMAPVSGSVVEVVAELGTRVTKGAKLATVVSDDFARAESEFLVASAALENAKRNWERRKTLRAVNQPGRSEYEMAVKESLTAAAMSAEASARFERSKRLVEIGAVSREQHDEETARFKASEAEAARAKARLSRAETVLGVTAEVLGDEEEARETLARATGEQAAARSRLKMFGLLDEDVEMIRRRNTPTGMLILRANATGTVTDRKCNPGQLVQRDQELFRVTDLRTVWFVAQAFEGDARGLRVGGLAQVTVGGESAPRNAKIAFIDPKVNETTRTVQIRLELPNGDGTLKLGSFASAAFAGSGDKGRGIAVKRSALQRIGRGDVVFVAAGDGVTFELRPVRIGGESGGLVQIVEGLEKGERVVVDGSFLLRAEWLKRNPS